jgi:hypothetical protein
VKSGIRIKHHGLSDTVLQRQEHNVHDLTTTMRNFTNPFADDTEDLFNLVSKSVMPEKVKDDLCRQSDDVNLWAPMKKRNLATWQSAFKNNLKGQSD